MNMRNNVSVSDAITNAFILKPSVPNETTKKAIEESEELAKAITVKCQTVNELFEDLDS